MENNHETKKKKPGRPRKFPVKSSVKKTGISNVPLNAENCIEFVYDSPITLKKVFNLFKSMYITELCIEFKKETLEMTSIDHLKKSFIKVIIHCAHTSFYFCGEIVKIYVNPNNIEKIIQVLDKNYTSIAFVLKTVSSRSILNIIYKNDVEIDEFREIDLIKPNSGFIIPSFSDDGYPIKFTLPCKYFKKLVSDISVFADILTIEKIGNSPLMFIHTSNDKSVKTRHIVQSENSISLTSTLTEEEIFSSSVHIEYIKPLSSSLLSDNIKISADNNKNIIFRSEIDKKTIEVLVNTAIIRNNKNR